MKISVIFWWHGDFGPVTLLLESSRTTLNNNRGESFYFHPLLCFLLQIQLNPC